MHIVAQSGAINSLKYLVSELNANLETCLNNYNMTPLHSACKVNAPKIFQIEKEEFAKCFFLFLKNNHEEIVEYLISNCNLNLSQTDINGRSAIDICLNGKYIKCLQLIQAKLSNC